MSSGSSTQGHRLTLTVLAAPLALCRMAAGDPIPPWTHGARAFLSISRTPTELSIVADDAVVPREVSIDRPYRAFRVEGPLSLALIGIVAELATALATAKVPIFPIATYDTDYILVHQDALERAIGALESAGHRVLVEAAVDDHARRSDLRAAAPKDSGNVGS